MPYNRAVATIAGLLACLTGVNAHGFVKNIVVNGVYFQGYDVTNFPYQSNPPIVVGWSTTATDLGYVEPAAFGSPDIVCHRNAKPAKGHVRVSAGDSIAFTWNTWPDSHHGPILDYLAPCDGQCENVDKTTLKFFKIDGAGKADPAATASPGYWADDVMMNNGLTWTVRIPSTIRPGNYVLRHEIIALHGANQANGAQAYPQCFNLEITGNGTDSPFGVLGTQLYQSTDPGIFYNLYTTPQPSYIVPGPTIIPGASSSMAQSGTAFTATGTATPVSSSSTSTSTSSSQTGSLQTSTRTSTSATTATTGGSTTTSSSSQTPGTTTGTTASASTPTSATGLSSSTSTNAPAQSFAPLYGQCGGQGYQGPTACAQPKVVCSKQNDWYSQCTMVPA